jgi:hypothetical protein
LINLSYRIQLDQLLPSQSAHRRLAWNFCFGLKGKSAGQCRGFFCDPHQTFDQYFATTGPSDQATDRVGIFPNEAAIVRLIGAILLEQNDEWAGLRARYYMTLETIAPLSENPIPLPVSTHDTN